MRGIKPTLVTAIAIGLLAGSAVGVAAQDAERAAPVPVTGESREGPCAGQMPSEVIDGVRHERSGLCSSTVSFSDPRLEGEATYQYANTSHLDENGVAIVTLGTEAKSIVNDNGAWRQPPALFVFDLGSNDGSLLILYGEGDYEGLVAVFRENGEGVHEGFIIDGDFPPPTEPVNSCHKRRHSAMSASQADNRPARAGLRLSISARIWRRKVRASARIASVGG